MKPGEDESLLQNKQRLIVKCAEVRPGQVIGYLGVMNSELNKHSAIARGFLAVYSLGIQELASTSYENPFIAEKLQHALASCVFDQNERFRKKGNRQKKIKAAEMQVTGTIHIKALEVEGRVENSMLLVSPSREEAVAEGKEKEKEKVKGGGWGGGGGGGGAKIYMEEGEKEEVESINDDDDDDDDNDNDNDVVFDDTDNEANKNENNNDKKIENESENENDEEIQLILKKKGGVVSTMMGTVMSEIKSGGGPA